MIPDHYSTLGVPRKGSAEDILHAYRSLALRFHPDRNSAADAASKMVAINKAYEVLGDPRRRRDYDRQLAQSVRPSAVSSIVLQAARDVVLRGGWHILEDLGRSVVFEKEHVRLRVVFVEGLDNIAMSRITHGVQGVTVVLAASVDGTIASSAPDNENLVLAIDLMRGRCYGPSLPEGDVRRSLLTLFL